MGFGVEKWVSYLRQLAIHTRLIFGIRTVNSYFGNVANTIAAMACMSLILTNLAIR